MYEGRDERESPMERETEVARPIEGVWDKRTVSGEREGGAGLSRAAREVKSPEDGPRPPRAVVSVVIQEGRVDETKETRQRGGGAEKAGGERGRVSWNAAVVPVYTRAGPSLCPGYLCIYVEHRRTPST